MKKFLRTHGKAILGFGLYYVLYAVAVIWGIRTGYSFFAVIGSGLLLLIELLITVGGSSVNHMASSRDYQRQPYAAQDLPRADVKMAPNRFSVRFILLLTAPPLLFFLILFLLSFILL